MPGQKRSELLTDTERERLINRENEDAKIRGNNDLKARKKLAAWLQNVPDVLLILDHLPREQVDSIVDDEDIYKLFNLIGRLLRSNTFLPVFGQLEDESWKTFFGDDATDLDIWRAFNVYRHIFYLADVRLGDKNPFAQYEIAKAMSEKEGWKDRLTPEELRGIERIDRAIKTYGKGKTWKDVGIMDFTLKSFVGFAKPPLSSKE